MELNLVQACELLLSAEDILLLAHRSPDGDTLGSCFALCYALAGSGKRVRIACADPFPKKYDYFTAGAAFPDFEPRFVAAIDVADDKLLGSLQEKYPRVDLCIDHHPSNTGYAENRLLDPRQAATAQLCFLLLREMQLPITPLIADCLFTGLTTDTGCFRYASVTAYTHRIAAELIALGANAAEINRRMFETKTPARLSLERQAMRSLEYAFNGSCALIAISLQDWEQAGATEEDFEGIAALPRQIEGVLAGITLREKPEGWKVSLRTQHAVNASAICAQFGGGGHQLAAGCMIAGPLPAVREQLLAALAPYLAAQEG